MLRRALAGLAGALLLAGCSFSQPVARHAIDYNSAIETAANTLLLRNVLRSRDNAPLHFTAVPQIRGSISVGISQPGLVFPVTGGIGTRDGGGIGLQALSSPSFDVAALDTQEFTRGLLEPIEPQLFRYFAERGHSEQMLVLLMIDAVVDPVTGGRLLNDPRCWFARPDCPVRMDPEHAALIERAFLTNEGQGRYYFHDYASLSPIGPALSPAQAADPALLAMLVEQKFRLLPVRGGRFQLYRETTLQAVCRRPDGAERRASVGDGLACGLSELIEPVRGGAAASPTASGIQVQLRSVADIFRFLGNVVRVQEQIALGEGERVRCLAFPVAAAAAPGRAAPEACLFHVTRDPADELPSGTAFSFQHGGETYRVPAFAEPSPDGSRRGDYTMRVMALLTELLNLKKSSAAIPTTRAVQIVR
jgi:hypothetical protein